MIYDLLGEHGGLKPWTYPGGEEGIRFRNYAIDGVIGFARVRNSTDLVRVLLALQAAWLDGRQFNRVVLPYLPYARQDRVAAKGDPNAAAWLGSVIRASMFNGSVFAYDVHSECAKLGFQQSNLTLTSLSPIRFIRKYVKSLNPKGDVILIAPDKGAADKTRSYAATLGAGWVQMEKVRDPNTGKLTGFKAVDKLKDSQICASDIDPTDTVVVVDDICDGGGTFLGVADGLLDAGVQNVPHLWTTHGIYSKGFNVLAEKYKSIACLDTFAPKSHYEASPGYDSKFLTVFEHDFVDDYLLPLTQG
jgi:ribose-phosphate pyrophosphokinase